MEPTVYNQGVGMRRWLLLVLAIGALSAACSSPYMVRDERGKLIDPKTDPCRFRATEFERSLCEVYADPFDFQRVRLCMMRELLEEFAKREGPASTPAGLLRELDSLHVGRDSARVDRLLRRGLAEMDVHWESDTTIGAFVRAIETRVEQALRYHTYRPDHEEHFDELGMLIALKGPFVLESWDTTVFTLSFPDGTYYHVVEPTTEGDMPKDHEHVIKYVSPSFGEMDRLVPTRVDQSSGGPKRDQMSYRPESHRLQVENRRKIDIYSEYLPLQLADISLHVIPAPVGDGLWNGRAEAERGQTWDSRRLLVDCFLNVDRELSNHAPGDTLDGQSDVRDRLARTGWRSAFPSGDPAD
jgi:hypothetical protein